MYTFVSTIWDSNYNMCLRQFSDIWISTVETTIDIVSIFDVVYRSISLKENSYVLVFSSSFLKSLMLFFSCIPMSWILHLSLLVTLVSFSTHHIIYGIIFPLYVNLTLLLIRRRSRIERLSILLHAETIVTHVIHPTDGYCNSLSQPSLLSTCSLEYSLERISLTFHQPFTNHFRLDCWLIRLYSSASWSIHISISSQAQNLIHPSIPHSLFHAIAVLLAL